ncbi:MAG: hypothetical protein NC048_01345 [Bacteroides sp.]|nr:hypothetical protein [Ruminococcus flavefaciens]MCM1554125.1 hypothetical protein [Bacteroides sp.]
MKRLKFFAAFTAMVAGMLLLSSCEKEVETAYRYEIDVTQLTENGTYANYTYMYLTTVLDWDHETERIDNDASSTSKAKEKNDREAVREFDEAVSKYNEVGLYGWLTTKGVTEATGYFTYKVTRVEDGMVLGEKRFVVDYRQN